MNRERKRCRSKFYEEKGKHLKDCKPALWWKEVKRLSGFSSAATADSLVDRLQHLVDNESGRIVNEQLTYVINSVFLSPMSIFIPLSSVQYLPLLVTKTVFQRLSLSTLSL